MTRSKRRINDDDASSDDDRPSPPKTRRRNEAPRPGDVLIQVECGLNVGEVCLNKLRHGSRGACVKFDGGWMTPNQFQMVSGRETAKDWKRSIKHHGKTLKALMHQELLLLEPPVCLCEVCTADDKAASGSPHDDQEIPLSGDGMQAEVKAETSNVEQRVPCMKIKKVKPPRKKLDIRIPAVFEKMKRKAEVTATGSDIRKKIKMLIDKSPSGSNVFEIVSDLSREEAATDLDLKKEEEEEEEEEEKKGEGCVGAVGSKQAAVTAETDERASEAVSAGKGREEDDIEEDEDGSRKRPKGSRLSSIIDELRRSKQHIESDPPPRSTGAHEPSSDTATEKYKVSPLASNIKTSQPKIATVTPLPPTKKPSFQVQPSMKKTKEDDEPREVIPPLSKDFLDITNPAHFSWYLPYYASLGLANMMMVPFLSNQMKKNDDDEIDATKSNSNTEDDIEPSTTPSPLDLSKNNSAQCSPQELAAASSPSECPVAPLDLSRKPSNATKQCTTSSEVKKVKSRRKSTPRMNAAGFLNPSLNAISKWTIQEVVSFVNSVDGCQKYTQNFHSKAVSGQSLPYLSLDQMTGHLEMSQSSAVSLRSAIDRLLLLPRSPHP